MHVNAGPLAYAQAFLSSKKVGNSAPDKVNALRDVFRDFVNVCNEALDLNATLITTEQKEYHESLTTGFQDIISKLSEIFGEKKENCLDINLKVSLKCMILTSDMAGISQRGSMSVFNLSVASPGSNEIDD
ncbi:hypothetical protein KUTeg_012433 [Tegillarca granosa]|uniref:DOCKER domain-containing protein n=1 Tax=Tegillarca granosa TaxID=220873 RepID=A0ABQ9EZJ0_TEGGR|nr:hypothetical protein KUTeg_012433 [Tegillarca granosa]